MLHLFQPSLGARELAAVQQVFQSNWLGRGDRVARFEQRFAGFQGVAPGSMVATTCASCGAQEGVPLGA
jgi:dTDP-4-amino-4,6-dideoxygalactose transaminase